MVGIVLVCDRHAPEVVEVLVGDDEGLDLVVLKHLVDALALEALVHPLVGPAAVEQELALAAVQFLDLDQGGEPARRSVG